MIEEKYVSFEIAKLLKSCGFFEGIEMFYDEDGDFLSNRKCSVIDGKRCCSLNIDGSGYLAPTLQMAMDWLRTKKNIDIDIHTDCGMLGIKRYTPCIQTYKPKPKPELLSDEDEWNDRWVQKTIYLRYENDKCLIPACKDFSSHEEAVEAALKYTLENLI